MPAPTVCTVTGTLRNTAGAALVGATIKANLTQPFIHTSDGSLIANYEMTTESDINGLWSLDLVETETDDITITITFYYATGSLNPSDYKTYTVTVPNTASATFASLVSGQI